jgi:polyisoprenoid-binding protein YceI
MNNKLFAVGGIVVAVIAAGAIWWFTSTDIDDPVEVTAPTLAAETTQPTEATTETTTEPATETTAAGSTETTVAPTPETTAAGGASGGATTLELTEGSLVTFEIDELLNGDPFRVVATNPEVAAQLRVDPADLSTAELGTIVIGAQTFATDSGNRDRAIRGPILDSNDFPTIEFVPTAIEGLSGAAAPGDLLEFTVTGDLTVRDITAPTTFTVSATLTEEGGIEGTAESTVSREVYGLEIPSVPIVADVSDDVFLKIDFVAAPIG